jgi:hypothetical protein
VIVVFVPIFSHLMTVFVVAVAIPVPIADLSGAVIIAVMIVPAAVVSVMVVPDAITEARIVAKTRIVPEARFVLASPFQIFPLALTAQAVVFHVVVPPFGKPLAVVGIILTVVAPIAGIRAALIPML